MSSAANGRDEYSDLNFRNVLGVASTAVSRLALLHKPISASNTSKHHDNCSWSKLQFMEWHSGWMTVSVLDIMLVAGTHAGRKKTGFE